MPLPISCTIHHKPSTILNPIIHILVSHAKTTSVFPFSPHLTHFNFHAFPQLLNFYSILQLHTTHPSHLPVLYSLQPSHALILHCPHLTAAHQDGLPAHMLCTLFPLCLNEI